MKKVTTNKIKILAKTALVMIFGLFIFKFVPMEIFGRDIKFDASAHITITIFWLYVLWFFVDQNKSWRTIFFILSLVVISIVAIQRILVDAHSDIGLLGGLIISFVAIIYSQPKYFKNKFKF